MSADLQARLQAYLPGRLGDWPGLKVGPVTRLPEGWESELYTFDVEHGPSHACEVMGLVLRLYPGDGAAQKAQHEFTGMQRLHRAGYPVPRVYHVALGDAPLGHPFILMDRIDGAPMWLGFTGRPEAEQQALLAQLSDLFVQLHRLDWRPFAEDPARLAAAGPYAFVDEALTEARRFCAHFELPGFDPLVGWLATHRAQAACPAPAVTHRDFHPNNVLLRADGSAVVIDWSGLAVTDPRFDLAWTLMLAQSHAGGPLRDALLSGYERASGAAVEGLRYFEAFACARRLADVTVSLTRGAARMGMRPEAGALMQAQLPAVAAVHDMLEERTGLRLPEVEALLRKG